MLLPMACRVAGGGKGIGAVVARGMRTQVLFLPDFGNAVGRRRGCRRGGGGRSDRRLEVGLWRDGGRKIRSRIGKLRLEWRAQ